MRLRYDDLASDSKMSRLILPDETHRMNGQLSEYPVGELIREISAKKLSGRLRLQRDRVAIVSYFEDGVLIYGAANIRALRLREYLLKHNLVSNEQLEQVDDKKSDLDLASWLVEQNWVDARTVKSLQIKQLADVLRLALLWTDGTWEFDHRSHLNENVEFRLNVRDLFLEAGRRIPPDFAESRFRNKYEVLSLNENAATGAMNLEPREGFVLSRLEKPTPLNELLVLTGLPAAETFRSLYSLALAGFINRENWRNAFRDTSQPTQPVPAKRDEAESIDEVDLTSFLTRVEAATTHYQVLSITEEAAGVDIKNAYYDLARRYHPDRFRKADPSLLTRLESAFARITQAYDTLRDDDLRANYNAKLQARRKAQQIAEATAKRAAATTETGAIDDTPQVSVAQRAANDFKEGLAALEQGQRKLAAGLFASAARLVPNEARYRAYYGHMLAGQETTRRAAEAELQAAIKLDPGNANYRVMLAQLFRDLGFSLRAKGEAERAVAADPNNQKARDLLRELKGV